MHVVGVDAHAGFVGAGHQMALVDVQVHHAKVFRFAISPPLLKGLAEKLTALARQLGEAPDPRYRPLEVTPRANGRDHGHTKQLPVLPLSHTGDVVSAAPVLVEKPASLSHFPRKPWVHLNDDQVDAAMRKYVESDTTLAHVAAPFNVTSTCLSQRFIARYGHDYARRARAAQQQGPKAVEAFLASAGVPDAAFVTKPNGAAL